MCWCTFKCKEYDKQQVQSETIRTFLISNCEERLATDQTDNWAMSVKERLANCTDLAAYQACYHNKSRVKLYMLRGMEVDKSAGKPENFNK